MIRKAPSPRSAFPKGGCDFRAIRWVVQQMTGLGVKLHQPQSRLEGSVKQPHPAIPGHKHIGIDYVDALTAIFKADDFAAVHPLIVRTIGIERGVGGIPDAGVEIHPRGNGVIKVILAIPVMDIRRPEVALLFGNILGMPFGELSLREDAPSIFPLFTIGGSI